MILADPTETAPAIGAKTILFVEDEPLIRAFVPEVLRRAGHKVLTAPDGIEGSVLFSRGFDSFDLLITDLSLPCMTGIELASFVRAARPDLPILFASGSIHAFEENPANLFERSAFLAKPFTTQELLDAVDEILSQSAPFDRSSLPSFFHFKNLSPRTPTPDMISL